MIDNEPVNIHRFGRCDVCGKPFAKGEQIAEPRNPDGTTAKVHPRCMYGGRQAS